MMIRFISIAMIFLLGGNAQIADAAPPRIIIGSKSDVETIILGELAAHLAANAGAMVDHKKQLGGTPILWNALKRGDIDLYPEYTGTLTTELLKDKNLHTDEELRRELANQGLRMSQPLGFNNSYGIGMKEDLANKLGIRTISDLRRHPELKLGFTNEFINRGDGWPGLKAYYQLPQTDIRGLEHALAYRGLEEDAIQATDVYTTDAEIAFQHLRVLADDRNFFPRYDAVLLYRANLEKREPAILAAILRLEGRISEAAIIKMNGRAKPGQGDRVPEATVAGDFLVENGFITDSQAATRRGEGTLAERLLLLTGQHLRMVLLSLGAAIIVSIPLGIVAVRVPWLGQGILAVVGLVQTIPSMALLVFFIPLFGVGVLPAVIALFLYSLLPIVRNTYTGLKEIPSSIMESAQALGLPARSRLRLVEMPLASRNILAGIKTSAVINVGTATLGGFIGAGGYGDRIFTGLRLASNSIILEGAIPAALLALLVLGLFELAERRCVPLGLRLPPAS